MAEPWQTVTVTVRQDRSGYCIRWCTSESRIYENLRDGYNYSFAFKEMSDGDLSDKGPFESVLVGMVQNLLLESEKIILNKVKSLWKLGFIGFSSVL